MPAKCPQAEKTDDGVIRCPDCFRDKYETAMISTPAGELVERCISITNAMAVGFQFRPEDVAYDEYLALQVWQQERQAFEREQEENRRAEQLEP